MKHSTHGQNKKGQNMFRVRVTRLVDDGRSEFHSHILAGKKGRQNNNKNEGKPISTGLLITIHLYFRIITIQTGFIQCCYFNLSLFPKLEIVSSLSNNSIAM